MSILIQYFVKLSISLAVVWIFYQFVLRRLTFYNSNRWYLLGYTAICFFIPFINISPIVEGGQLSKSEVIRLIPAVDKYTDQVERFTQCPVPVWSSTWDKWDWALLVMAIGAGFLFLRFAIRCFSFLRLRNKATLLSDEGMKLYHVDDSIIPFSFGNSIFINRDLHKDEELHEIIRHEFVHVKQRHTVDIIWSELLCMLNWYNPFAWLIRADIRQNLEFIADNKVLENGVNKKQYQYLLLKVIGNNHFSIAQKFNFSSLKKRIAMMNKIKTAKVHLLRFLFIIPLLAVILVSFRNSKRENRSSNSNKTITAFCDTVPVVQTFNEKGYNLTVTGNRNNAKVIVQDSKGKIVETVSLEKWNDNEEFYENKYGSIAPPPPPVPPVPPLPPSPVALPDNVEKININNHKATVTLKDGKIEKYDLEKSAEKAAFEKKYGAPPESPIPPVPPIAPVPPVAPVRSTVAIASQDGTDKMAQLCEDFEITKEKAVMKLKNGQTEEYNLTKIEERRKFEKKYGRIIEVGSVNEGYSPVAIVNGVNSQTVLAPMSPITAVGSPIAMDTEGSILNGEVDILVTISKTATRQDLDDFKKKMKEIGIALSFDQIEYDEKGILVRVGGEMKSKEGNCNFSASDFSKVTLSMVRSQDRIYFKVDIVESRVRI